MDYFLPFPRDIIHSLFTLWPYSAFPGSDGIMTELLTGHKGLFPWAIQCRRPSICGPFFSAASPASTHLTNFLDNGDDDGGRHNFVTSRDVHLERLTLFQLSHSVEGDTDFPLSALESCGQVLEVWDGWRSLAICTHLRTFFCDSCFVLLMLHNQDPI